VCAQTDKTVYLRVLSQTNKEHSASTATHGKYYIVQYFVVLR